jgi:hypothetical protein
MVDDPIIPFSSAEAMLSHLRRNTPVEELVKLIEESSLSEEAKKRLSEWFYR